MGEGVPKGQPEKQILSHTLVFKVSFKKCDWYLAEKKRLLAPDPKSTQVSGSCSPDFSGCWPGLYFDSTLLGKGGVRKN